MFPFYHWVLDDEREAFAKQLRWYRNYGDFIDLDSAVQLMEAGNAIGGRYFCITFDDGFENCYTNAAPVLAECGAPAAFFLPTRYVGMQVDSHWREMGRFFETAWTRYRRRFDFLSWDQCREMARAGFTFGSHTHSHIRLTNHTTDEVVAELRESKAAVERELGAQCRHFACPWGRPNADFDPLRHPALAASLGFVSFLSVQEGPNVGNSQSSVARRNAVAPGFSGPLLRYHLWLRR